MENKTKKYIFYLFILTALVWGCFVACRLIPQSIVSYFLEKDVHQESSGAVGPKDADAVVLLIDENASTQASVYSILTELLPHGPSAVGIDIAFMVDHPDTSLIRLIRSHQDRIVLCYPFDISEHSWRSSSFYEGFSDMDLGDTRFGNQNGIVVYYEGNRKSKDIACRPFPRVLYEKAAGKPCRFKNRGIIDFSKTVFVAQTNADAESLRKWYGSCCGKMVIIGSENRHDMKQTPFGFMNGAEILALAASTIKEREANPAFLSRKPFFRFLFAGFIMLACVILLARLNHSREKHPWRGRNYGWIVNGVTFAYVVILTFILRWIPPVVSFNYDFWSFASIPLIVVLVDDFINNNFF